MQKSAGFSFLVAIVLFNPVILFLLIGSVIWSLVVLVSAILILYYSYLKKEFLTSVLLLNFFSVISILLHLETGFRFGFPEYIIENLYTIRGNYYFNKPNLLSHLEDKEYAVTYKTNEQGFRIPDFANTSDSITECDWLFLGDSFTQGAQVSFEELYTSQLYSFFPHKVIINAGISGFSIADEYHYYIKEGKKLKPKKVFLQICNFNDFMNVSPSRNSWIDYLMQYSDLARYLLYNIRYKSPGELPLGRWTEPFYPNLQDNVNYNIFFKESSPVKQADINAFKYYLKALDREVKADGAELIIILIPTKEQTYYRYLNEVLASFNIAIEQVDLLKPNNIVSQLTDSLKIQLIDLLPDFQSISQPQFFEYDEHLNALGHKTTATVIFQYLEKRESNNTIIFSKDLFPKRYPNYSSDGKHLVFQSIRDGTMELFLVETSTEKTQRLTYNKIDESHPMLSPDGSHLIFTEGNSYSDQTKITIMNTDGTNRHHVTSDKNEFGAIPFYSASSHFLTYAGWFLNPQTNQYTNPQIILLSNDSGVKKALTSDKFESWRPVISPKDEFIIFISKREGNFNLFKLDLKTLNEVQLTHTPYDEWDPTISTDGTHVLYSARKNKNWDLFELSLKTGKVRQLTSTIGDEWDPNYCPSDTAIIYGGRFGVFQNIYRMSLNRYK